MKPYAFSSCAAPWTSPEAAIATAAQRVLLGVIPSFGTPAQQAAAIVAVNAAYASSIATIPEGPAKKEGITVGAAAAAAILALRAQDGALLANIPYAPSMGPGFWQPTPNPNPPDPAAGGPGLAPALLPGWGDVTPFTLESGRQFRSGGPPPLSSRRYARDYDEVKSVGERVSTTRTAEQSEIARFWYEGSQVGWNRIARVVAEPRMLDLWEQARLFALVNFAMADGFIAGLNAKYFYNSGGRSRPFAPVMRMGTITRSATRSGRRFSTRLRSPDYPSTHSVLGGAASRSSLISSALTPSPSR